MTPKKLLILFSFIVILIFFLKEEHVTLQPLGQGLQYHDSFPVSKGAKKRYIVEISNERNPLRVFASADSCPLSVEAQVISTPHQLVMRRGHDLKSQLEFNGVTGLEISPNDISKVCDNKKPNRCIVLLTIRMNDDCISKVAKRGQSSIPFWIGTTLSVQPSSQMNTLSIKMREDTVEYIFLELSTVTKMHWVQTFKAQEKCIADVALVQNTLELPTFNSKDSINFDRFTSYQLSSIPGTTIIGLRCKSESCSFSFKSEVFPDSSVSEPQVFKLTPNTPHFFYFKPPSEDYEVVFSRFSNETIEVFVNKVKDNATVSTIASELEETVYHKFIQEQVSTLDGLKLMKGQAYMFKMVAEKETNLTIYLRSPGSLILTKAGQRMIEKFKAGETKRFAFDIENFSSAKVSTSLLQGTSQVSIRWEHEDDHLFQGNGFDNAFFTSDQASNNMIHLSGRTNERRRVFFQVFSSEVATVELWVSNPEME